MVEILAPCSAGDLFDRLSILALKVTRLRSTEDRAHAARAHDLLDAARHATVPNSSPAQEAITALETANAVLWDLEEDMRRAHTSGTDAEIAALSRKIVAGNAARAHAKRAIDEALGSEMIEVKDYASGSKGA